MLDKVKGTMNLIKSCLSNLTGMVLINLMVFRSLFNDKTAPLMTAKNKKIIEASIVEYTAGNKDLM